MTSITSSLQGKLDSQRKAAVSWQRRYDVDWLRTLAMALLIIYHATISFQPWANELLFPQNEQSLEGLWILMGLINVWRIPILFLISGMGVRFAMERRDWKQLLKDRTIRILLPFIFGLLVIAPIPLYIGLLFYGLEAQWLFHPVHLWFLANIFLYVLLLLPLLFYLKNRPDNLLFRFLAKLFRWPVGLLLLALPLVVEVWLVNPDMYSIYAMTPHGFMLGFVCFFMGFLFISMKDMFWPAVERVRWLALALAFSLYLVRFLVYQFVGMPSWIVAFESMYWMLAILGFGSLYLNKPSNALTYYSKAVYPVYIVHLPVQFLAAFFLLPLPLPPFLKLFLLLVGTFGISLLLYEVLRRLKWVRPLFGMKFREPLPIKAVSS